MKKLEFIKRFKYWKKQIYEIKDRIKKCKRCILLATDGAVESKWCNWELGFADAIKGKKVVLFPMKEKGSNYKGNEYMEIYSYITYFDGREEYDSGKKVKAGYYVMTKSKDKKFYNSTFKLAKRVIGYGKNSKAI